MTINNENSCSDNLASILGKSAQWRLRMKASYPADSRNGKAADMLERLASEITLTDEEWALLDPHYSWASETWTKVVSAARRT
ncbi:hypothetical protein AB8B21_02285 [Tardiphaga sp. 866_E4_N2_1]|uniref:hypothetical protein n=1 Tax=unclassified Tardiphaga TaxID=2631404 RepID=UPI003F22D9E9